MSYKAVLAGFTLGGFTFSWRWEATEQSLRGLKWFSQWDGGFILRMKERKKLWLWKTCNILKVKLKLNLKYFKVGVCVNFF